jgi:hypothetical protein
MSKRYPRAEALALVSSDFLRFAEKAKKPMDEYWPILVSYIENQRLVIGE